MITTLKSIKLVGIDGIPVNVETQVCEEGIGIHLIGLADAAVKEALLRTVTALQAQGFHIPGKKIIINLAPADLHKNGTGYDLPIALGLLAASGQKEFPKEDRFYIFGELGLDGSVRDVPGAVQAAERAALDGCEGVILPRHAALSINPAFFPGIKIYGVYHLREAIDILEGKPMENLLVDNSMADEKEVSMRGESRDMSDIRGNSAAKRALEIAAAGGHHIILIGDEGTSKAALARAMRDILPVMTQAEAIEVAKAWSATGRYPDYWESMIRPIREVAEYSSIPGTFGGGVTVMPGEVTLADKGVLILRDPDKMPKSLLEGLRVVIEDRQVTISRLKSKVVMPADSTVVCTMDSLENLEKRTVGMGPLLDRIDIQMMTVTQKYPQFPDEEIPKGETSATVAARVEAARERQAQRYKGTPYSCNGDVPNHLAMELIGPKGEASEVLMKIITHMNMSARAVTRIAKIARTIADLEGTDEVLPKHIAEAAGFRFMDRLPL